MLLGAATAAHAQQPYPAQAGHAGRALRPGGGNDILARAIAPRMGQILGKTVVVDNRPGAGGNLGTDLVARAAADGYTVVIASSQVTMNPVLGMKLPFRIESDFEPVGLIASVPIVLVSNIAEPYKTLEEFIEYSKAHPGKLTYSSPGNGTPQHMAGEVFAKLAKTEMLHVPYRGTGPSISDLIGGQVQVSFATFASVIQHVDAGKLRALGIAGQKRTALMPELPTFAESGALLRRRALVQPAGAREDAEGDRRQAERGTDRRAEVARGDEQLTQQGFETRASMPDELKAHIAKDMVRWQRVITDNRMRVAL